MPHDNGWAYGMATLSEVVLRLGDEALAVTLYDEMLPFAHLMATGGGEIAGGSLERSLGQVAAVLGRTDDALAHFERARARAPRLPGRHLGHPHRRRRGRGAPAARHRRGPTNRRGPPAGRGRGESTATVGRARGTRRRALGRVRSRRPASRWAHAPRGRGRSPRRPRSVEPRDRGGVRALGAHRRVSRAAHPHEARLHVPSGDRRVGGTERPRRLDDVGRLPKISTAVPWSPRWRDVCVPAWSSPEVTPRGDAMNHKSSRVDRQVARRCRSGGRGTAVRNRAGGRRDRSAAPRSSA